MGKTMKTLIILILFWHSVKRTYFEAYNEVTGSTSDSFNREDYQKYFNVENLPLKTAKENDYSLELTFAITFYKNDFN